MRNRIERRVERDLPSQPEQRSCVAAEERVASCVVRERGDELVEVDDVLGRVIGVGKSLAHMNRSTP